MLECGFSTGGPPPPNPPAFCALYPTIAAGEERRRKGPPGLEREESARFVTCSSTPRTAYTACNVVYTPGTPLDPACAAALAALYNDVCPAGSCTAIKSELRAWEQNHHRP